MNIDSDVADRARQAIGTRFRHQGRIVGVGIDCLGLVVHAIGGSDHDRTNYRAVPDTDELLNALANHFDAVDVATIHLAPVGSIVAFAFGARRRVRHLGVRTEAGFIHAIRPLGVVETTIVEPWVSRFAGAYRWRSSP